MIHTALHRLTSYLIINKFLASFDESRNCTSEIFIPIDCTDTSTSQLTTSSMPITILLEDTVCQLLSGNATVFEDCQQRIFDHTEVTGYPIHKRLLIQLCMYTQDIEDTEDISEQCSSMKTDEELIIFGPIQETDDNSIGYYISDLIAT